MISPLADRVRPESIDDLVGQPHLLGKNKALRLLIESGKIPNMVFYGPSGVGKTTVANIIAKRSNMSLHRLNATTASTADIRNVISEVDTIAGINGILLYLDEIQYFNKRQQQTLLEHIENGNITLIASTTENPNFYVYNALLSRLTVFEFKELTPTEIVPAILRAAGFLEQERSVKISFDGDALKFISEASGGDVRRALNILEICVLSEISSGDKIVVTVDRISEVSQLGASRYDRSGDDHYDIISAYQKSMRGSDPDAALYYLARLLEAGDLPSACRRLLVCANEDVGMAYPQIISIVKSAVDSALMLGLPEARIPLANAVVLVSTAPKSNSAYAAINEAMKDVQDGKGGPIPRQLQNKHFDGEDAEIKGQNYLYPHDFPGHYVLQQYLPDPLKNKKYYLPGDNKSEQAFAEYMKKLKGKP